MRERSVRVCGLHELLSKLRSSGVLLNVDHENCLIITINCSDKFLSD